MGDHSVETAIPLSGNDKKVAKYIEEQIEKYNRRAAQARRKVKSLSLLTKKVEKQKTMQATVLRRYHEDDTERKTQIADSDVLLSAFRKSVSLKNHQMEGKYKAIHDLESNIKLRGSEVDLKIRKIQDALVEWHAASQIVSSNCQTSVYHAAEKFHTWHQTVPAISCWLANEARVRSTIYASANMIGMQEEISAQQELKKQLQEFKEQYYKDVSQQARLPPLKQINEQRQHRSELFDQFHVRLTKQLRAYVRACESLEYEIVQKEQLRMRLNSIAMEVRNALHGDLGNGLSHCESEARRKIEFVLQVFSQVSAEHPESLSEQLLMDLRNRAQTALETEVLEQVSGRHGITAGLFPYNGAAGLDQGSLVSSLSGSEDMSSLLSSPRPQKPTVNLGSAASAAGPPSMDTTKDDLPSWTLSAVMPMAQKPFQEIRDQIKRNRGKELLRTKYSQVQAMANHYNPKLCGIFEQLHSERDEDGFSPDRPVHEPDESIEVIDSLNTLNAVKTLQVTTSNTVANSVALLQRLLKTAKREEESIFDLHNDRPRPMSSANSMHPSTLLAMKMEKQQTLGYQELHSMVSKEFQKTQVVLEDWLFSKINKSYENTKASLIQEFSSLDKLSPEVVEQLTANRKVTKPTIPNIEGFHGLDTSSMSSLPYPAISAEEVTAPKVDETENNVRDMLTLSERLLMDLEKQLQAEVCRNEEAFCMQPVKDNQRLTPNGHHEDNRETGVVASGNSEDGDILLATAEIIMHNDLYHISLVWRQREMMATFIARNLLPKRQYKEYVMNMSIENISEVTGMNVDNVLNYVLQDTQKAFQQITHHIQVEEIRPAYYGELKEAFDRGMLANLDILMYLPHYLPFGSEIYHHNSANQVETSAEQTQGLLLKVMTCRAAQGGLLLHCFARIRAMR